MILDQVLLVFPTFYFAGTDLENKYMTKKANTKKTIKANAGTNNIILEILGLLLYFIYIDASIIHATMPIILKFMML